MNSRTDYEAVTARGVTIRTFADEDQARKWLARYRSEYPGVELYEVEHVSTRTKLPARKRSHLQAVA